MKMVSAVAAERTQNLLVVMAVALTRITFVTSMMTVEIIQMRPGLAIHLTAQVCHLLNVEMATAYLMIGNAMEQMTVEMLQMK